MNILRSLTIVLLPVALASCRNGEKGEMDRPGANQRSGNSTLKGPGKFVMDFRESGDFFTLMDGMKKGESPHGTVQIWYSTNARNLIGEAGAEMPEGTTAIKPSDTDGDGDVDHIAVMIKMAKGFDPDNGDWYYEMRTPEGKLMENPPPGKTQGCIACHKMSRKTDYLGGTTFR